MTEMQEAKMAVALREFQTQIKGKRLPYEPGTRGIVSTVAPSDIPVFIISLRMLRRTGCQLPVELFLRTDEDDWGPSGYLCGTLLPSYNARCVMFDRHIGPLALSLQGYQHKIFSVIFSSFEEVLLLDADSFPVSDPEPLFTKEPFVSKGMVTWPDFWINSASFHFFRIAGIKQPPLTERASSESGQVMLSKKTHSAALLVAAYYNFAGPKYYYELQTQGGPGEGDKETFIAAAETVSRPFYQVRTPPIPLGFKEDGELKGVVIVQHDPVQDYAMHQSSKGAVAKAANAKEEEAKKAPLPFFMHANFPKMNPVTLFEANTINHLSGFHRLWETNLTTVTLGKDVERQMWEEMRFVACEAGDKFRYWKAKPHTTFMMSTCETVEVYIDKVFGDGSKAGKIMKGGRP